MQQGTSLVVQWLRLRASTAGGMGSIPGLELRSHMPRSRKKKKKERKKKVQLTYPLERGTKGGGWEGNFLFDMHHLNYLIFYHCL